MPAQKNNTTYLTTSKAAKYLGVSPTTLRRLETEGRINAKRLENGYRVFEVIALNTLKHELHERRKIVLPENFVLENVNSTKQDNLPIKTENTANSISQSLKEPKLEQASTPLQLSKTAKTYTTFLKLATAGVGVLFVTMVLGTSFYAVKTIDRNMKNVLSSSVVDEIKQGVGEVLGERDIPTDFWFIVNVPTNLTSDLTVQGDATFAANIITQGVSLTGTGALSGLQSLDEVSQTTIEGTLSLGGDVTGTLNSTSISADVINNDELASDINYDGTFQFSNVINITGELQADGDAGSSGQVLTSTGSGIEWANIDAEDANTLDGIDSTQFLRSDVSDQFTSGTLSFSDTTFLDLSAITHSNSTPQGFKLPQADILTTPSSGEGYLAYDTDADKIYIYNGSAWTDVSGASTTLQEAYDAGEEIQMTAAQGDIRIYTDGGNEALFVLETNGFVGIGTTGPTDELHVAGNILATTGIHIGTDTTGALIDDAANGASSTTLYIGNESILASGDIGVSVQGYNANTSFLGQTISNAELVNSSITVNAGTGLSGGGTVSLGGTISLTNVLGNSINESELEVTNAPTDDYILTFDLGTSGFTWVDPSTIGGTIDGTGTANYITKWTDTDTITTSAIYETGGQIGIGTTAPSDTLHIVGNVLATTGVHIGADGDGTLIDDASNGASSTTLYIGNESILASGDIGVTVQAYNANTSILGSSIEGNEITDGTIEEIDLEVTNSPTDAYILSYDSGTGGFTWIANTGGSGASKWTDAGTYTYLTGTSDDLILGGTTTIDAPFWFDVSTSDIVLGGANVANGFETTIDVTDPTADNTIVLPDASGEISLLGQSITTGEITDDTILEIDLDTTNAPTDNFILAYDQVSGGFTWINPSGTGIGSIDGSGTTNYITKWSDADTLTESIIFDTGTSIGIGTTGPSATLHVLGDFTVDNINLNGNTIAATNDSGLAIYDNASNGLFLEDGGNVGIGTTNPAYLLDITGTLNATGQVTFSGLTTGTDNSVIVLNASNQLVTDEIDPDVWTAGTLLDGNGTANYLTKYSDADTLTNSVIYETGGNLGIGTTAPTSKLSIGSSSQFQVSSTGDLIKVNNVTYSWPVTQAATDNRLLTNDGNGNLTWESLSDLGGFDGSGVANYIPYFSDEDSLQSSNIYYSGSNIGIGTTNPAYKLDVQGTLGATGQVTFSGLGTSSTEDTILTLDTSNNVVTREFSDFLADNGIFDGSGTANYITKWTDANTLTDSILYELSGQIGIGTTAPEEELHIKGTAETAVQIETSGSTSSARVSLVSPNSLGYLAAYTDSYGGGPQLDGKITLSSAQDDIALWSNNGTLNFFTAGGDNPRMIILNTGLVGIGNTTPTYQLDVTGTARATGQVNFPGLGTTSIEDTIITLDGSNNLVTREFSDFLTDNSVTDGSGTTNYVPIWTDSNTLGNSSIYEIGGNVGIGTTAPGQDLHISTATETFAEVETTSSNYSARTYLKTPSSEGYLGAYGDSYGGIEAGKLVLSSFNDTVALKSTNANISMYTGAGSDPRMHILNSGLIGIGTTAPTYMLDIVSGNTTGALQLTADSVTTGTGSLFSFDGLTSGTGMLIESAPSSATVLSGDLFRINVGLNSTITGNIMSIEDNGSALFTIDQSTITSALPHSFTAAGDVSMAYDLIFTNQVTSKIESYGPLTIEAGESFESNDLTLKTYGAGNIVLNSANLWADGNYLGIGTTNPSYAVDISGTVRASGAFITNDPNGLRMAYSNYGVIWRNDGANFYLLNTASGDPYGTWDANRPFRMNMATGDTYFDNTTMFIDASTNRVGINKTTLAHAIDVVGTAGLSTGTAWTNTSDSRFKNELGNIKGTALDRLMQLRPVAFEWNDLHSDMFGEDPGKNYGFIAQEVANVIPEFITRQDDGYYYYNPSGIEAILTAGVQEQQDQINYIYELLGLTGEATESTSSTTLAGLTDMIEEVTSVFNEFKSFVEALGLSKQTDDEGNDILAIASDLNVVGNATLADVTITGTLTAGLIEVDTITNSVNVLGASCFNSETNSHNETLCEAQELNLQNELAGNVNFFNGAIVLEPNGTINTQKLAISIASAESASAGQAIITAGQTFIQVHTTALKPNSLILISPDKAIAIGKNVVDEDTFEITLQLPEVQDITVDWLIVDINE